MRYRNHAIVALMSITLIALELVWTRIFSAELFYTFAFLILSLAILGLGLGALALRLLPFLDREGWLGGVLSLAGLCAVLGPIVVFRLGLDFTALFTSPAMIAKLALTVLLLSSSFFFGGIALAILFKRNHHDMPRLYMADLAGAGAGVLVVIALMNTLGTPVATFLGALPILAAAALASSPRLRLLPLLVAVLAVGLCPWAGNLLEAQRQERAPVIYKYWDAMAKIKVYDFGGQYRGINIDNVANSPVFPFDGDFATIEPDEAEWGIDVSYLIGLADSCTFLSLGAGGGGDVLQALVEGASEVHAVEVNPHINHMMLVGDPAGYLEPKPAAAAAGGTAEAATGQQSDGQGDHAESSAEGQERTGDEHPPQAPPVPVIRDADGKVITLADYSGHLYRDRRVRVVSEDARTYIRRHRSRFDLIYSLSSNTWAALGSGSFAFAENYIFTTEAFIDYWRALTPGGFLSMEHQVYMPRIVASLIDALEQLGVADPGAHFAVYDLPQMRRKLLLLSKRPLTDEVRNHAFGELTAERWDQIHLLYPAPKSLPGAEEAAAPGGGADNLINRIAQEGWQRVATTAEIDVSPSSDDRPFVAQMGLWRNFSWDGIKAPSIMADFRGFPLSKSIIAFILLVVLLVVLPLNLAPYLRRGERLRAAPWFYFFTIGMGFMAVEVVLIQKYALFIGASVYSIATVLLTLLIASGIGSRFSQRVGDRVVFGAIVLLLLLDVLLFRHISQDLSGLAMLPRALVTSLLVAPLGFFMGMPFPKGTARVGELVDWGLAVNGAASVLGATLIVLIAFAMGFSAALLTGALLYLAAFGLIRCERAW